MSVGAMASDDIYARGERVGGTVRAEEGGLPLATIIPTSARWLPYNSSVRAKSVGSIARLTEFGSGILMSIGTVRRRHRTQCLVGECGTSAPDHQQLLAPE